MNSQTLREATGYDSPLPAFASDGEPLDRYGLRYDACIKQQTEELALWTECLRPEVYNSLADLLQVVNSPRSKQSQGRHNVPRGWQLAELILNFKSHPAMIAEALL